MEQEAQSMKGYHFYAMLSRMKYINRWGLMRNTREENICEHSLEVAMIAHSLAVLKNQRFGGRVNPERAALLGMFHDAAEIITGDLPTPVKYFNSEIRAAYQEVENMAKDRLLSMLPEDLRPVYEPLLSPGEEEQEILHLVRAADKISALIKCIEEKSMGNAEFCQAELALREAVSRLRCPEADCFLNEFLPSYSLTLDEQE